LASAEAIAQELLKL